MYYEIRALGVHNRIIPKQSITVTLCVDFGVNFAVQNLDIGQKSAWALSIEIQVAWSQLMHHLQKPRLVPWASSTAASLLECGMTRNDVLICRLVQTPPSNLMRDRALFLSISLKAEGFPYLDCSLDARQARTMLKIVDVFKRSSDSAKVALIYGEPHTNPTKLASHLAMSLRDHGIWSAATYCPLQVQDMLQHSGKWNWLFENNLAPICWAAQS